MALTSMACVDSLSFKFSLHHLEDTYVAKPPFYYSWSEPFDLDFAGKARETNPKRSRSQPATLVSSSKSLIHSCKKGDRKQLSADIFRDSNPEYSRKTEVSDNTYICDIHSNNSTSAKDLSTTGSKYVNETEPTKSSPDCEDDFTSDEELAEICCVFEDKKITSPSKMLFTGAKGNIWKEDTEEKTKRRKRTLDNSHISADRNVSKRPRPRLDFEKMRLSRNETSNQNCSTKILFDETFFKPILPMANCQY